MFSKEDAENLLYEIFYQLNLDKLYEISPESTEINFFEATQDPEHLEHNWHFNKEKTKVMFQIWALDYKIGTQYLGGNLAYMAAIKSQKSLIFKRWTLLVFLSIITILGLDALSIMLIDFQRFLGIIPLFLIGTILFLFFFGRKYRNSKLKEVYIANLNNISDKIETNSLEKYSTEFFKLYNKTFITSTMLILTACISIVFLILTITVRFS